jgi:hypothetical protein
MVVALHKPQRFRGTGRAKPTLSTTVDIMAESIWLCDLDHMIVQHSVNYDQESKAVVVEEVWRRGR